MENDEFLKFLNVFVKRRTAGEEPNDIIDHKEFSLDQLEILMFHDFIVRRHPELLSLSNQIIFLRLMLESWLFRASFHNKMKEFDRSNKIQTVKITNTAGLN